jgi:hypothetical protein
MKKFIPRLAGWFKVASIGGGVLPTQGGLLAEGELPAGWGLPAVGAAKNLQLKSWRQKTSMAKKADDRFMNAPFRMIRIFRLDFVPPENPRREIPHRHYIALEL